MIIGEVINSRYDIKMLIGDGGMANVYLAYDRILRKNVAIKMLRYELSKDESFIKRFHREANQVTTLEHSNIVSSYAIGEYKEQPFIVMEYIRGKTVKDKLRDEPFTEEEAVYVMIQVCYGVVEAHSKGIIHRDLKSQNILIDEDLNVKIADFGIALSSNEAEMTQTNTIMGSVHYLAPELARGSLATTSSDIYSLGILFYELLTGTVPFKGEGAVNVALQHMENDVPSVRLINPAFAENYDYIIKKATAKKTIDRYPNVSEMIEDLRKAHIEGSVMEMIIPEEQNDEQLEFETVKTKRMRDDYIPYKSPKKFSLLSLINGVLYTALLAVIIYIYFIIVIIPGRFETPHTRIPDVIGLTESQAQLAFNEAGLYDAEIVLVERENHFATPGTILQTNPTPNTQVRIIEDRVIRIYVATNRHHQETNDDDYYDDADDYEDD